jgi:alpha-L-fucosidase
MTTAKKPLIRKLGTIDCDLVETTPVVYNGRLYRFEYVRENYSGNKLGQSYFRFIDCVNGKATPAFAEGFHLGSAFIDDRTSTVYAYGVPRWGEAVLYVFWSDDMVHWSSQVALDLPGWGLFNTSVCLGRDCYVMAFEIDAPPWETGVRFTIRFAKSDNLLDWTLTPPSCVFTKERYSACPAIRFVDDHYYMAYLETLPGPRYETYIVRSPDLVAWQDSPFQPFLSSSDEDRQIACCHLDDDQIQRVHQAVNNNNSDPDLCEWQGKTIITYSWGNQQGIEHLAEAVYDGSMSDFLHGFFPD